MKQKKQTNKLKQKKDIKTLITKFYTLVSTEFNVKLMFSVA